LLAVVEKAYLLRMTGPSNSNIASENSSRASNATTAEPSHAGRPRQRSDTGAAGGALMTGLALRAWQRGYDDGPFTLLFAGSERGLRSALVLETGEVA
jgi:hypothetical protein